MRARPCLGPHGPQAKRKGERPTRGKPQHYGKQRSDGQRAVLAVSRLVAEESVSTGVARSISPGLPQGLGCAGRVSKGWVVA